MNGIFLSLAAILSVVAVGAQQPRWLDPEVVSIGKELPRGDVVSHGSRDEAIRKEYHKSKYLQPLTEWERSERDGAVVYRTRFKVPFEWIDRQQFLYLGKVSGSFDVVVNGETAGYSQTGSTPSEFDLTAVSREGSNDLEVVIYRETAAQALENSREPAEPRILGETYILSQPRMRVRDIFIDTRTEGTHGIMELGVIMKSHQLNVHDYKVYYELLSPKGEILSEGYKDAVLDMRREDTVRFFANVPRIVPWSHEEPRLYTLFIKTQHEGRFKEYLAFQIGFRRISVEDGMIHLNGTPLNITMREFTPTGDLAGMRSQIGSLMAEGVNTLKMRGAPPSHEFYALCDEMGVYLCNQADIDTHLSGASRKVGGNPSNDPRWEGAYRDRVMNMYHTSKNSPSMIMFSIADDSANGYNLYESYRALKAAESRRPVIYTDSGEWNNDPLDFAAMTAVPVGPEGQWVDVTAEDVGSGRFRLRNNRSFTPVIGEAAYKVTVGRKVLSAGSIPLEVVPQGESALEIPIPEVKAGKKYVVRIEVKIERPVNKYVPSGQDGSKKVFRSASGVPEKEKIVIGQFSFTATAPVN